MKTRLLVAAVIVALLALPVGIYAQDRGPVDTAEAFVQDVTDQNVDEAMAAMDPAAEAVTDQAAEPETAPEGEGEPAPEYSETPQQTYSGEAEIRAWIEGMVGANASMNVSECAAEGNVVTCDMVYADDLLRAVGVAEIAGEVEMEVVEGKIVAYDFVPSAESVAAVKAAVPATLPKTGGAPFPTALVLALGGLAMVVLGLGGRLRQRHRRTR